MNTAAIKKMEERGRVLREFEEIERTWRITQFYLEEKWYSSIKYM